MNTNLDKTEEILLQTVREHKKEEEIIPSNALKNKLDKALEAKRRRNSVFARQIPFYQSVAAAVLFFLLGLGSTLLRPEAPPKIVHTTTEVVKYVEKPVVTEVVKYVDRPVTEIRYIKEPLAQQPANHDTFIIQNAALYNSNENVGISLHDDTVLQKMLITIPVFHDGTSQIYVKL
jgi:hypothetical protein